MSILSRRVVTLAAASSVGLLVALCCGASQATEYGDGEHLNPAGEPAMVPQISVVKVVPGRWVKRNPYIPNPGRVTFSFSTEPGLISAMACDGVEWENSYGRGVTPGVSTLTLRLAAGNPDKWSQPATYLCRVSTRTLPWGKGLRSEDIQVLVPAVKP